MILPISMSNYILIDGSYFVFYRFHALKNWWTISQQELGENISNIHEYPDFIKKFESTFAGKIHEIGKKLKIKNPRYIVGKDCPRDEIWRNDLIENYKTHRADASYISKFFKMAYESLFRQAGVNVTLTYPKLEADDCIAITTNYLREREPDCNVWIITSDMDYLQLASDNVHLFSLKYKSLTDSSMGSPEQDLFCKIVMGDKSDGIPSIFPKCGFKTTIKYLKDRDSFEKKLSESETARALYKRNRTIIDFNYIPLELREGFIEYISENLAYLFL